jgi:hypothetical protein
MQEASVGNRQAGVRHQMVQEVELFRRQVNQLARLANQAASRIELNRADPDDSLGIHLESGGSPDRRPDARRQFPHAEWFGDVIVRAGIQSRDLIFLAVADREHDNSQAGETLAHLATRPDASDSRHVDVEQNDIVFGFANQLQSRLAGRGFAHIELHSMECIVQRAPNGALIVNDQNLAV